MKQCGSYSDSGCSLEEDPVRHGVEAAVLGRAIEALINCADDLEAELRARYPEASLEYPSEARRFNRDMQAVNDARASIRELNATPGFNWAGDD